MKTAHLSVLLSLTVLFSASMSSAALRCSEVFPSTQPIALNENLQSLMRMNPKVRAFVVAIVGGAPQAETLDAVLNAAVTHPELVNSDEWPDVEFYRQAARSLKSRLLVLESALREVPSTAPQKHELIEQYGKWLFSDVDVEDFRIDLQRDFSDRQKILRQLKMSAPATTVAQPEEVWKEPNPILDDELADAIPMTGATDTRTSYKLNAWADRLEKNRDTNQHLLVFRKYVGQLLAFKDLQHIKVDLYQGDLPRWVGVAVTRSMYELKILAQMAEKRGWLQHSGSYDQPAEFQYLKESLKVMEWYRWSLRGANRKILGFLYIPLMSERPSKEVFEISAILQKYGDVWGD
jgi:hypothetical protein